jgi:DNA helicase HerA-like ATPase
MANNLTLAPNFSIPAVDYAGQGNAILGIRDAGKTYTAMKAAEELLENKIPIIVYDPVGIWKNLKVGTGKHKGFPVVVAGGEGSDIRLTINNAVDIVRAAMKENVSLVIDLYAPELINKSTWIRIVQETVDLLMYENKPCGLRHIFIEEAAEFIPQRLQPQHSKVYASLERLARMGRNARLGYTLINQRAEEVNKAILEISAFSLLHKQVGKNSLKSIQTWMELLQVENAKEIIHSLPSLKQGECWVIGMNTKPHRIKVSERKTFHPDPKQTSKEQPASTVKIDVSSFVEKLNKQLEKPKDKRQSQKEVPKV